MVWVMRAPLSTFTMSLPLVPFSTPLLSMSRWSSREVVLRATQRLGGGSVTHPNRVSLGSSPSTPLPGARVRAGPFSLGRTTRKSAASIPSKVWGSDGRVTRNSMGVETAPVAASTAVKRYVPGSAGAATSMRKEPSPPVWTVGAGGNTRVPLEA